MRIIPGPALAFSETVSGGSYWKKIAEFRYVMDVIATDPYLVKGQHGVSSSSPHAQPILISNYDKTTPKKIAATDVCELILQHLFDGSSQSC